MASTPFFTRSLSSAFFASSPSITTGRPPQSTSSISPSMTLLASLVSCSCDRWISRSVTQKTGSPSSSPTQTLTMEPSFFATTPWMASGMVTHWYFLMPP